MISNLRALNPNVGESQEPFVSILVPAFNEEDIITDSIERLYTYMERFAGEFEWELIIVNDGSGDQTGVLADALSKTHENLQVIHHRVNRNLGGALQTGFRHCSGYYIIVLDIDLSYSPDHIERMLTEAVATDADIVVASPYMKGGKCTAIPPTRLFLSKTVNFFMRITSPKKIHTFTGMVRTYRKDFLDGLNLKSVTYSINPEIIHKAIILRGRIIEVPAHLDWSFQKEKVGRSSSIRILSSIMGGLMTSFIFRPYAFFMTIGSIGMLVSFYIIAWIFIHTFDAYAEIAPTARDVEHAFSQSVASVFFERPYSFLVGGISLIISIQLLSLGILSLQNKRYFDELFHLGSFHLRKK